MVALEQLTLNGALTLLSYLQCSRQQHELLKADAIAVALCEMLTQPEDSFPGVARYSWTEATLLLSRATNAHPQVDSDMAITY